MTPQEMQQKSADKVKQIVEMMKLLYITVEARERVDEQGFISKTIFWIDNEKYPAIDAPAVPEAALAAPEALPGLQPEPATPKDA